jgi:hypothetical protein
MKKTLILLLVIACASFVPQPEKKLKVELSAQQWQAIINQLDNSSAPHNEVKITTGWLVEQLRPQLIDTTKAKK